MKKNIAIICLIFTVMNSFSQQTPKDISLIFNQLETLQRNDDNFYDSAMTAINAQLAANANNPINGALWHFCKAELLNSFAHENRWKIDNRTTLAGEKNPDFKTWDIQTLYAEIVAEYQLALRPEKELQSADIQDFKELINIENKPEKVRSSLYDLLAHRMLDFLDASDAFELKQPLQPFRLNDERYFADNQYFTTMELTSTDTLSPKFLALQILQKLTDFHLKAQNLKDLVDITLIRLDFCYENAHSQTLKAHYLPTLRRFAAETDSSAEKAEILYEIATFYDERMANSAEKGSDEHAFALDSAVRYYEKVIATAPQSRCAINAENAIAVIKVKEVSFETDAYLMPNRANWIRFKYKNTEEIFCRIVAVTASQYKKISEHVTQQRFEALAALPAVTEWRVNTDLQGRFCDITMDAALPPLPVGTYVLVASPTPFNKKFTGMSQMFFQVTHFGCMHRNNIDETTLFVFDRETGKPIENQDVTVGFSRNYNPNNLVQKKTYTTDERGAISVPKNKEYTILRYSLKKGKDHFENAFDTYRYFSKNEESTTCKLFTDRAIYRPGQTIYYKGIVMMTGGDDPHVLPQKNVTIILKDANFQEVGRAEVATNDFGSFSGSFQLPTSGLTGSYQLTCLRETRYFRVEEYKRPTFEVEMEQPEKTFKLGETVEIGGVATALAGFAVDGATVRYRVERSANFPFYFWRAPYSNEQEIAQGEVQTDAEGKFRFTFVAEPDDKVMPYDPVFDYQIIVDVTDISGETHSATIYVSASYKSLLIDINIPESLEMSETSQRFTLSATNVSGAPQPATITCTLYELAAPAKYLHNRKNSLNPATKLAKNLENEIPYINFSDKNSQQTWEEVAEKWHETISVDGSTKVEIPNLSHCKPGYYKIKLASVDIYGNDIVKEEYFFIYDKKSKECTAYSPLWMLCSSHSVEVGDTLNVLIGSYLDDARFLFEITNNDTLLHSEWLSVKRGVKSCKIAVDERFRGTIRVAAFLCDHNFEYTENRYISVPFTSQKLDIEFVTLRDKLLPGSDETWQIKVKDKKGAAISAEMLASMYDAALNAFESNGYSFYVSYRNASRDLNLDYELMKAYMFGNYIPNKYVSRYEKQPSFPQLRVPFSNYFATRGGRYRGVNMAAGVVYDYTVDGVVKESVEMPKASASRPMTAEVVSGFNEEQDADNQIVMPRTNFDETAFFFPQLLTDENGSVIFSFKIPESLTKWRFQGVAHTPDLKIGICSREVQTQKMLMVQPNAPSFFRTGDTVVFSAKISNLSDTALNGKATLQLFNALTNEPLNILQSADNQEFTVVKGGSQAVSFRLAIPSKVDAITYRILASARTTEQQHTDGVEATLPVLPNRMLVTESMQMPIQGGQTKLFTFDKMKQTKSSTLEHHRFTLEFTPNPIWYAIQSLPYLMDYPYDCNEQIFSKLYANSISSYLVNSSPKIKQVFDEWKESSPDAFCSQLEKNEELKSILLEETPWVLDAQSEASTRQRIGLMFDLQRMSNEEKEMLRKLDKNQNSDGSWSWFKGGYPSRYITQHIVAGFGHLRSIGVTNSNHANMTRKAVQFIDNELTEDYNFLLKQKSINLNDNHLTSNTLHAFYARSFFLKDFPISTKNQKAYNYFLNQIKNYWSIHSIYMQAISALVLHRNGEQELAKTVMLSIKKRAQRSEEMGMFWVKEGAGYFWTEALIERQALLIEAFQTILNDTESVDQMKVWLLKQKQTQHWNTTKATTEAVYALLLADDGAGISTEMIDQEAEVDILVGGRAVSQEGAQAGTGYFKKAWTSNEISPEMANVTVKKANKGVAWGGLYWQYFEDLDKITAHNDKENPLALQKKLYKVALNERGEVLQEIGDGTPLRVGDKVRVRVEIRADRDFEYVHLKDMRAAAFEPTTTLSGYRFQDGLGYYESMRDAAANYFFDTLRKGTYVFEYTLVATQAGVFSNGISSIQCMYAPEFAAHSAGEKVQILE